jgi:hypothetical protein
MVGGRSTAVAGIAAVLGIGPGACGGNAGGDDGATGCSSDPVAECRSLCAEGCARVEPCGIETSACNSTCLRAYACPGETSGQDALTCSAEEARLPRLCADLCTWAGYVGERGKGSSITCNAQQWETFAVTQGGFCPTPPCEWTWFVSKDGSFTSGKSGVVGNGSLTAEDLMELDAIVSSPGFQDHMQNGFNCGPPPLDASVSVKLHTGTQQLSKDATACVFGSNGEPVARAVEIVTAY